MQYMHELIFFVPSLLSAITLLDMIDNEALVLYVMLSPQDSGTVTYYVPVILMSELEETAF